MEIVQSKKMNSLNYHMDFGSIYFMSLHGILPVQYIRNCNNGKKMKQLVALAFMRQHLSGLRDCVNSETSILVSGQLHQFSFWHQNFDEQWAQIVETKFTCGYTALCRPPQFYKKNNNTFSNFMGEFPPQYENPGCNTAAPASSINNIKLHHTPTPDKFRRYLSQHQLHTKFGL